MTDNVLLLDWCKKETRAAERIEYYKLILQEWPESVTQHVGELQAGSVKSRHY